MTISTHSGHTVALGHNRRDPKIVSKETHINPDGCHEAWLDREPKDVYHDLFDDAQKRFNEKQTHKDRIIKSYYGNVSHSSVKHPVYEMIAAVGNKSNTCDTETGKSILHEYVDGWERRNPNLALCGVYYHADEEGVPHVHIDYVPYADGFTRGMERQTSYAKALAAQGFTGRQCEAQWSASENAALESICRSHGLEIEHPMAGKGVQHAETAAYKAAQAILSDAKAKYDKTHADADKYVQTAVQKAQTAIRDMDAANYTVKKVKGELDKITFKDFDFKPQIIAQQPQRRTLSGKVQPATVMITQDDYNKLVAYIPTRHIIKEFNDAANSISRNTNLTYQYAKALNEDAMYKAAVNEQVQQAQAERDEARRERDEYRADAEVLRDLQDLRPDVYNRLIEVVAELREQEEQRMRNYHWQEDDLER